MYKNESYATCKDCGQFFNRGIDEEWKVRCILCYISHKKQKREEEYYGYAWQKRPEANQTRPSSAPDPIIGEFNENLATLVRLCHPDKHGNSEAANEVTKWLLAKRKEVRGKQQ